MKFFLLGAAIAAVTPTVAMASESVFVQNSVVSVDLSVGVSALELNTEYTLHALSQRLDATLISGKQAAELCKNPHDSRKCVVDLGLSCSQAVVIPQGMDKGNGNETSYTVTTSLRVPAFFQEAAGKGELKAGNSSPAFRARFRAQTALGRCTATVLLNGKRLISERNSGPAPVRVITVVAGEHLSNAASTGFIEVDEKHRQYFADSSSGNLFFPIGPNLAWPGGVNSTKPFYSSTLPALQAAGGNYARIWLGPSQIGNSPFSEIQLQRSLGVVDADAANFVDWLIDQSEKYGIRLLLALDSYNALCTDSQYFCSWDQSVYNAKNGGPCDQCDDFWTSASSYNAFQDYARAVVARWGASTSVFAWQMWNEMDGAIGGTSDEAGWWLGNITTYIASIDAHNHLISNSYAQQSGIPAFDQIDTISFSTTHAYEGGDIGGTLGHYTPLKAQYGKPTYAGEFGRNASPYITRLLLHNGIWGTVARLGAASGACWYWQDVFDPKNNWQVEFEGISTFIQELPRSGPKRQSLLIAHSWTAVDQNSLSPSVPSGARLDVQMSEDGSVALGYLLSLAHVTGNNPPFPLLHSFNATLLTPACSEAATGVIQWFNTSTGLATGKTTVPCSNGTIVVTTPDLVDDRAFLLQIDA